MNWLIPVIGACLVLLIMLLFFSGCANESNYRLADEICTKAGLSNDTPAYDECVEKQVAGMLPPTCMRWGPRVACY